MKNFILMILALFFSQNISFSEEIHFDNETYKLKFSALAPNTQGYGNEYYKNSENVTNWNKMIGIYYYPEENDPIKYAGNFDEQIENTENSILLKLVENKQNNKAIISFLVNGSENSRNFFEYDVYKFEKQSDRGMIVSKYAQKFYFKNDSEINKIANQIKENNDKYLELLAISATPQIIEKDINEK